MQVSEYDSEMNALIRRTRTTEVEDNDSYQFNENLKTVEFLEDQPNTKCKDFDCTENEIYMCTEKGETFSKHCKGGPYSKIMF